MEPATLQLPPFFLEVDGCKVQVLEVLKSQLVSGATWYHIAVIIDYKGIKSRRYTLNVRDTKDLLNKLKVEITKIKFIDYGYGLAEVRRLIS